MWTGWNKTTTRRALTGLSIEDIDLHGQPGIALTGQALDSDAADHGTAAPIATLLPALDPTPMGWKHRHWFSSIDPAAIYDRPGNIGPALWWDGQIIGSWAVTPAGEVRTVIVADRGEDARHAAAQLHTRLDGAVVTPAARTPLEQSLTR